MLRRSFLQLVGLAAGTAGLLVAPDPGSCPPRNPHCPPTPTTTTLPPPDEGVWSDEWSDLWS